MELFWNNNARARALFDDLLARSAQNTYDDDYLAVLDDYEKEAPDHPHLYVFAARYMLAHGDAAAAADYGERAFLRAPLSHAVWQVLAHAYMLLERYSDALVMAGYLSNLSGGPITPVPPSEAIDRSALDRLSIAMGYASYAPFAINYISYTPDKGFSVRETAFAEEFLPVSPHIEPPYYVGVYTEQEQHGNKKWLLSAICGLPGFKAYSAGDLSFEIIRGRRAQGSAEIDLDWAQKIVLPILGTAQGQQLRVQTGATDNTAWLNDATPNFFRLEEQATFSSAQDFIIGTPIILGHRPERRRLVLNILADALSWTPLRNRFAEMMPQTHRFFSHGLIFDRHFSAAEYTHPALAAIETGMYLHHSHLFNEQLAVELRADAITLSERMKDLGYATANLMGDGNGIYNGATRGYDRLVVTPYCLHAYEGVERCIRYVEGLPDADHFIFLHFADTHPWPNDSFQVSATTQLRLPITDRLCGNEEHVPSPYLKPTPLNQAAFLQSLRDLDRALGTLFSYLEQHYAPEDYIVNLYADHGVSIFSRHPHIVYNCLTSAAWMMRGAGIPAGGLVDEPTSAVDIYRALAHLCGFPVGENVDGILPQAFGGTGREIAFSNSLFPGKTYHLAARAKTHTLFLDSEEPVAADGTLDLSTAMVSIYPSDHEKEPGYAVDSEELRAFFYPRVREFLQGIDNNGEIFPMT